MLTTLAARGITADDVTKATLTLESAVANGSSASTAAAPTPTLSVAAMSITVKNALSGTTYTPL